MTNVIFETPGTLDLRAIKTFGINSKPHSSNPIGYFGTGLKYAIAVLLREGLSVKMATGGSVYYFDGREQDFREKSFKFIYMNDEQLPFTTELGKNWKLWQAFRELYSNTLDESGETYHDAKLPERYALNKTYIMVTGESFVREYDERFMTFLRDGAREGSGVQIMDHESRYIFYRGMRIHDLKKPSVVTYNVLDTIDLTEDRTARYSYMLDDRIKTALVAHRDEQMLIKALDAPEDTYEASLDFSGMWQQPGEEFTHVAKFARNRTCYKLVREHDKNWLELQRARHIFDQMIDCINANEWYKFSSIAQENSAAVLQLLVTADRHTLSEQPPERE